MYTSTSIVYSTKSMFTNFHQSINVIYYSTLADEARFINGSTFTFMPNSSMNEQCRRVSTTEDMLLEVTENFTVVVNASSLMDFDTVVNLVFVSILDDDGKCF